MTSSPSRASERSVDAALLRRTTELAVDFLNGLDDRPVTARTTRDALLASLGAPLADDGIPAVDVVEALAAAADPGLIAMAGPRFFGFVIGGSLPAALAADWLTSTWDQNAGLFAAAPAASVVEEVVGDWLVDLLGLPAGGSFGLATGCQMAHFTCLAAARHAVLRTGRLGRRGRRAVRGAARSTSSSVPRRTRRSARPCSTSAWARDRVRSWSTATTRAGCGSTRSRRRCPTVGRPADRLPAGRQREHRLLRPDRAGDRADPCRAARRMGARRRRVRPVGGGVARVPPPARRHGRRRLVGDRRHKWLNVPYDSGFAFVRDPRAASGSDVAAERRIHRVRRRAERDEFNWVPEFSRRARGFAVYAALRSLGRSGVAEQIERSCRQATRMAEKLRAGDAGAEILNDVVLDQVLVRFHPAPSATGEVPDAAVVDAVDARRRPARAGGRDVLARRHDMAWHGGDADLDRELVHDRRGHRSLGCRDPAGGTRRLRSPEAAEPGSDRRDPAAQPFG